MRARPRPYQEFVRTDSVRCLDCGEKALWEDEDTCWREHCEGALKPSVEVRLPWDQKRVIMFKHEGGHWRPPQRYEHTDKDRTTTLRWLYDAPWIMLKHILDEAAQIRPLLDNAGL